MYAWLLLVYGIVQFIYVFKSRSVGGFLFKLLFSIIYIIAAILLLVSRFIQIYTVIV